MPLHLACKIEQSEVRVSGPDAFIFSPATCGRGHLLSRVVWSHFKTTKKASFCIIKDNFLTI
jgi:hypothetical protein